MSFALPQSFKTTAQEKLVGLFILFALAAFIYLATLKSGLSALNSVIEFNTEVKQSYGITLGAPVKLSGVAIGEVSKIALLPTGKVFISISLPNKYKPLYTVGSTLKIDSQFGFDTMLIGQGMIFQPGNSSETLTSGAVIATHEPQTLADLTKEFNLAEISKQVSSVIENFEKITVNIANKETDINQILTNSITLTQSLNQTSQQLPKTINKFEQLMTTMEQKTTPIFKLLQQRLVESRQVLSSSDQLMSQLAKLSKKTEPSVAKLPEVLEKMDRSLLAIELLTKQLQGLWYLGGKNTDLQPTTDEMQIPYYNNKESLNDLLLIEQKGDLSEQQN